MFSYLAQVVGMPLLGIGFAHNVIPFLVNLNFLFILGTLLGSRYLDHRTHSMLKEATGGLGLVSIILVSVLTINILGFFGAVVYVAASLALGSEGRFHGMLKVDVLHYSLAFGNLLFHLALA